MKNKKSEKKKSSTLNYESLESNLIGDISDLISKIHLNHDIPSIRQFLSQAATATVIKKSLNQAAEVQKKNREEITLGRKKYVEETIIKLNGDKNKLDIKLKPEPMIVRPDKNKFIVTGKIIDKTVQAGIPKLTVVFFDKELKFEKILGAIRTDEYGYFLKEYSKDALIEILKAKPDVYYKVLDNRGKQIYESETSFSPEIEKVETIKVVIDGKLTPVELNLGMIRKKTTEEDIEKLNLQRNLIYYRNITDPF